MTQDLVEPTETVGERQLCSVTGQWNVQVPRPTFFLYSVLCLGGMSTDTIKNRIGGQPMEFEWNIFPGITTVCILEEIHDMMISELQCEPEQFNGRIIFMSMSNDINWSKNQTETCQANAHRVSDYARRFQRGHWSFLKPGCEQKWYETNVDKIDGEWDLIADVMLSEFVESQHPVFGACTPLERG